MRTGESGGGRVASVCRPVAVASMALLVGSSYATGNADNQATESTSWSACYAGFAEHVDRIAGSQATDCGFWRPEQSKASLAKVKACAKAAFADAKAFKFGHADMGIDSYFCNVAIRDASGRLWSFFYDSDVSGGSGGPATIWVSECRSMLFKGGTIGAHSFFDLIDCKQNNVLRAELLRRKVVSTSTSAK